MSDFFDMGINGKNDNETSNSLDNNQDNSMAVELEKCKEESSLYQEKINDLERSIAYLRADIDNMRRQAHREVEVQSERILKKTILSFLSVFDDYERSIEYARQLKNQELLSGMEITLQSFKKVLQDSGITEIDATGDFNPEFHEAISTISSTEAIPNTIAQVVQKGFILKKNVLRPAKVLIFS